jgi:hypothetical protein
MNEPRESLFGEEVERLHVLVIEIPEGWADRMIETFGDRLASELAPGMHMVHMHVEPNVEDPAIRSWSVPE